LNVGAVGAEVAVVRSADVEDDAISRSVDVEDGTISRRVED
jgi:hypothetical protein